MNLAELKSVESESCLPKPQFINLDLTCPEISIFQCTSCVLSFANNDELILHQGLGGSSDAMSVQKSFSCSVCNGKFLTFRGMRQHKGKVHSSLRKIKCKVCGKRFKDSYAVKFHKNQVHDTCKQMQCVLCEKMCYNQYTHKAHFEKCSRRFFAKDFTQEINEE